MRTSLPARCVPLPGVALEDLPQSTSTWIQALQQSSKSVPAIGKFLQVNSSFGLMLQIGNRFIEIHGLCIRPLQALERNTGEVMLEALTRQSKASQVVERFRCLGRVVCCDQAGYNTRAEKALHKLRGGKWLSGQLHCSVHVTATIFTKTFEALVPALVKGVMHAGLCLGAGAAMSQFRICVATQVRQRLVITTSPLAESALQYKLRLLSLFTTASSKQQLHKMIVLLVVFNGDWLDHVTVQHRLGTSVNSITSPVAILTLMQTTILALACQCKPQLWPKHRWIGADLPLNEMGLLQSIHGLWIPCMTAFLDMHSSATLQAAMPAHAPHDSLHVVEAITDGEPTSVEEGLHAELLPAEDANQNLLAKEGPQSAEQNSHSRQVVAKLIASDPWPLILIVRQVLEPLRELIADQLFYSGRDTSFTCSQSCLSKLPVMAMCRGAHWTSLWWWHQRTSWRRHTSRR